MRHSRAYVAFRELTDRLLRVPKATVDARIAAYEAERAKIPSELKPGRNPKPKPTPKPSRGRDGAK